MDKIKKILEDKVVGAQLYVYHNEKNLKYYYGKASILNNKDISNKTFIHFGLSAFQMKSIFNPLIENGRLICTDPSNPRNHWQKFVTARSDEATVSAESVERFCQEPRSRQDVAERYGMAIYLARRYLDKMMTEGKLNFTMPDCPQAKQQRYVHPDTEINQYTEQALLKYCKTPRTRAEILKHFNFGTTMALAHHMGVFIKEGKIKHIQHSGK